MAYVEVWKEGKLVTRREVSEDKARRGCRIRLGSAGQARVKTGETKTVGKFEIRMFAGNVPETEQVAKERSSDLSDSGKGSVQTMPTLPEFSGAVSPEVTEEASYFPEIEGYKVTGRLGEGGMGTVWRAEQLSTHREVALKLLSERRFESSKSRLRFEREVELTARLVHPNIARLYDSGLYRGIYYYAMELIDGVHLDQYIREQYLSQRQILELMWIVCQAVHHAHQQGIIHRDLKPSNILVGKDGQPHVLDFGLAKMFLKENSDVTVSIEGDVAGTLAYMSPEQAMGRKERMDTRTDVYSLGIILYQFLTGESPHQLSGTRFEVVQRIVEEEVCRPREISRDIDSDLEALLLKALARDPDDRYLSAGEMADDIDNYLKGKPLLARAPTAVYFLRKKIRKCLKPIIVSTLALTLLAAILVLGYVYVENVKKNLRKELTSRVVSPPLPSVPDKNDVNVTGDRPNIVAQPAQSLPDIALSGGVQNDFIALFNGRDLTGWDVVGGGEADGWLVEAGILKCRGKGGGWLSTTKEYEDFELSLEFNVSAGGNSGVFVRVPRGGRPSYDGMEIQILDDYAYGAESIRPEYRCGAIWDIVSPIASAVRPAGQWNSMNIRCEGARLKVVLNNVVTVDTNLNDHLDKLAEHPGLKQKSGCIGLQDYGSVVSFRNIRIREINGYKGVGSSAAGKAGGGMRNLEKQQWNPRRAAAPAAIQVDGKPFFVICARSAVPEEFEEYKKAGFNTVYTHLPSNPALSEAGWYGLYAIHHFTDYKCKDGLFLPEFWQDVEQQITTLNSHPALLAWMQPTDLLHSHRNPSEIKKIFDILSAQSPNKLRLLAYSFDNNNWTQLYQYNAYTDVVVLENETIQKNIPATALWFERAFKFSNGRPVWYIVCAYIWENWSPSANEFRSSTYLGINHGATGILIDGFQYRLYKEWGIVDVPGLADPRLADLRKEALRVAGELKELSPAILAGAVLNEVQVSQDNGLLDVKSYADSDKLYIVAVNTSGESIQRSFYVPKVMESKIDLLGEARSVSHREGNFTDGFAPYETHVYILRLAAPAAKTKRAELEPVTSDKNEKEAPASPKPLEENPSTKGLAEVTIVNGSFESPTIAEVIAKGGAGQPGLWAGDVCFNGWVGKGGANRVMVVEGRQNFFWGDSKRESIEQTLGYLTGEVGKTYTVQYTRQINAHPSIATLKFRAELLVGGKVVDFEEICNASVGKGVRRLKYTNYGKGTGQPLTIRFTADSSKGWTKPSEAQSVFIDDVKYVTGDNARRTRQSSK